MMIFTATLTCYSFASYDNQLMESQFCTFQFVHCDDCKAELVQKVRSPRYRIVLRQIICFVG